MIRLVFFAHFYLFLGNFAFSQIYQTVRGKVVDKETHQPLQGATVLLLDTTQAKGAVTDEFGVFRIEGVKLGKQSLQFKYVGYKEKVIDIELFSAKELILQVELEESFVQTEEIRIEAVKRGEVQNELAIVSTRTFDVSETERYAGSRGDPARMASNFAGVQGADDSRNDIVVRGNSPLGVLYRLEGFDIPNPNHFSVSGSTGGPVSILNNKVLSNSDFFTSAFPAEYGNSTAAVFDLKLKQGNNEKHEFSGQLGFLGTELAAEGPIVKKKGSSYLGVFRYSTLDLFKVLGIQIGTDAVPRYQDLAFKFHFPAGKNGSISAFAIAGNSSIDIVISNQKKPSTDFYGEDDRDQYFKTRMGVMGVNYNKTLGQKTFLKSGVALSHEQQKAHHDYILRHLDTNQNWIVDSLYPLLKFTFVVNKLTTFAVLNTKISTRHVLRYGLYLNQLFFDFRDSALVFDHSRFQKRWDYGGTGLLAQAFVQWKYKPIEKMTITAGLHNLVYTASKSSSFLEPRLGVRYQVAEKHFIYGGVGLHSQTQPFYTYYYMKPDSLGNFEMQNRYMDFTKSFHSVAGYDWSISATMRLKTEIYYQHLHHVPVEVRPSSFSLSNMGSGFARFFPEKLQNTGTGDNLGIEWTLEKFFNKSFYFLFTASIFDAKYVGSDKVRRNTDYNGRYAVNFLAGKEFQITKKTTMSLGAKVTTAGGKWYGFVDTLRSQLQQELVFQDSAYNTLQFRPYFRTDLKINFKINAKKVTHEIALDLVNLLNTKNILGLTYSPDPQNPTGNPIRENYQLGFLPLFYYRIDF